MKLIVLLIFLLIGATFSYQQGYVYSARWPSDHSIKVCWMTDGHSTFKTDVENQIFATWAHFADINLNTNWPSCTINGVTQTDGIRIHININTPTQNIDEGGVASLLKCETIVNGNNVEVCNQDPFTQKGASDIIIHINQGNTFLLNGKTTDKWLRVVVHEFGHSFGILHEHNNGASQSCLDEIRTQHNEKVIVGSNVGIYDKYSIMHYECDGLFEGLFGPEFVPIGAEISCGDVATIRFLFGTKNSTEAPNCTIDKINPLAEDFRGIDVPTYFKETYAKAPFDTDTDDCMTDCVDTPGGDDPDMSTLELAIWACGAVGSVFGGIVLVEGSECYEQARINELDDENCPDEGDVGIGGAFGCAVGFVFVYLIDGTYHLISDTGELIAKYVGQPIGGATNNTVFNRVEDLGRAISSAGSIVKSGGKFFVKLFSSSSSSGLSHYPITYDNSAEILLLLLDE